MVFVHTTGVWFYLWPTRLGKGFWHETALRKSLNFYSCRVVPPGCCVLHVCQLVSALRKTLGKSSTGSRREWAEPPIHGLVDSKGLPPCREFDRSHWKMKWPVLIGDLENGTNHKVTHTCWSVYSFPTRLLLRLVRRGKKEEQRSQM